MLIVWLGVDTFEDVTISKFRLRSGHYPLSRSPSHGQASNRHDAQGQGSSEVIVPTLSQLLQRSEQERIATKS